MFYLIFSERTTERNSAIKLSEQDNNFADLVTRVYRLPEAQIVADTAPNASLQTQTREGVKLGVSSPIIADPLTEMQFNSEIESEYPSNIFDIDDTLIVSSANDQRLVNNNNNNNNNTSAKARREHGHSEIASSVTVNNSSSDYNNASPSKPGLVTAVATAEGRGLGEGWEGEEGGGHEGEYGNVSSSWSNTSSERPSAGTSLRTCVFTPKELNLSTMDYHYRIETWRQITWREVIKVRLNTIVK